MNNRFAKWRKARPSAIVRQIVGRRHVGESYLRICRYVVSRLKPGAFARMSRRERRQLLAQAIVCHRQNRSEYARVMYSRGATRFWK